MNPPAPVTNMRFRVVMRLFSFLLCLKWVRTVCMGGSSLHVQMCFCGASKAICTIVFRAPFGSLLVGAAQRPQIGSPSHSEICEVAVGYSKRTCNLAGC